MRGASSRRGRFFLRAELKHRPPGVSQPWHVTENCSWPSQRHRVSVLVLQELHKGLGGDVEANDHVTDTRFA